MKFIMGGLGNWFNDYKIISDMILEADRLGIEGALLPDHYMWGTMGGRLTRPDRFRTLETWTTISYLLAKTENIKLGTLVTPIPFRPPGMLAKMVSTMDNLSNGRVILGVGAGWAKEEFEGYSKWYSDKERVDRTKEGIELILKLWTEEEVNFNGKYYQATKAVLDPKPVQKPHPKLLFGGVGNRMLALAGRHGDIVFIPPFKGPEFIPIAREKVISSARKYNREQKIEFITGNMMGPRIDKVNDFVKLIDQAIESKHNYFLISFGGSEKSLDLMKEFAKEILPSYR